MANAAAAGVLGSSRCMSMTCGLERVVGRQVRVVVEELRRAVKAFRARVHGLHLSLAWARRRVGGQGQERNLNAALMREARLGLQKYGKQLAVACMLCIATKRKQLG